MTTRSFDVPAYSSKAAPLASTRLDRWALRRIQRFVRSAPIRFALWDGFELPSPAGPPVATIVFQEPPRRCSAGSGIPSSISAKPTCSARSRSAGDLVGAARGDLPRASDRRGARPWWLWQRSNDVARRQGERPPPLRPRQRLLPALARPRDALHLRLLPDAGRHAGGRADREDGSRLPQAAPASPASASSRPAAAGARWRCTWPSTTASTVRAFNISPSRSPTRGAARRTRGWPTGSSSSRTTTATSAARYDVFVSVGMLEHVGLADYRDARRGHRPLPRGARPRAPPLHRPQPAGAAQPVDPKAHLSRAPTRRRCARCSSMSRAAGASRCSTSRTCACTTRKTLEHWRRRFDAASTQVAAHVRRAVRARLAALPRRLAGGVPTGCDAAVPGGLRARRQQRDPVDAASSG